MKIPLSIWKTDDETKFILIGLPIKFWDIFNWFKVWEYVRRITSIITWSKEDIEKILNKKEAP